MNIKKPLLVAGIASGVTLASLTGLGVVSAATTNNSTTDTDPQSSLIQKIATKFGLKTSDVKAVFDQDRSDREAARQAKIDQELSQAVTDGKLTPDQKNLIVAKQAEVKTFIQSLSGKTKDERRTAMQTERTQLEQWAKDNNIPTQYLRFLMLGGPHGHGMGMKPDTDQDNAPSTNTN